MSLRPYVTAGAGTARSSRPGGQDDRRVQRFFTATRARAVDASFGSGISSALIPNFALSAEGISLQHSEEFPEPGPYTDGMNFQIAATFYLKYIVDLGIASIPEVALRSSPIAHFRSRAARARRRQRGVMRSDCGC